MNSSPPISLPFSACNDSSSCTILKEVSYFDVSCWTDADGKSRSRIEIVAEHVEFKPQFKEAASF
jgi:hypothetical protein